MLLRRVSGALGDRSELIMTCPTPERPSLAAVNALLAAVNPEWSLTEDDNRAIDEALDAAAPMHDQQRVRILRILRPNDVWQQLPSRD